MRSVPATPATVKSGPDREESSHIKRDANDPAVSLVITGHRARTGTFGSGLIPAEPGELNRLSVSYLHPVRDRSPSVRDAPIPKTARQPALRRLVATLSFMSATREDTITFLRGGGSVRSRRGPPFLRLRSHEFLLAHDTQPARLGLQFSASWDLFDMLRMPRYAVGCATHVSISVAALPDRHSCGPASSAFLGAYE